MSRDRPSRLERFLFAEADPRWIRRLRALGALMGVYMFWPHGSFHVEGPLKPYLPEQIGSFGYFGVICLLLAPHALGRSPQWTGLAAAAMAAPLAFLHPHSHSRQLAVVWIGCMALYDGRAARLPMWPIRLLQIQLSALYGMNALTKMHPDYLSGAVLTEMSRALPNFRVDLTGGGLELGPLLVPAAVCAWGTVATEGYLAIGFWFARLKWWTAALGVGFHAALTQVVTIGRLDILSVLYYLPFLFPVEKQEEA